VGIGTGPNVWLTPFNSGTGKATDFKFGGYSYDASELKPLKNFGGEGVWAYSGSAQNFWIPPINSGSG